MFIWRSFLRLAGLLKVNLLQQVLHRPAALPVTRATMPRRWREDNVNMYISQSFLVLETHPNLLTQSLVLLETKKCRYACLILAMRLRSRWFACSTKKAPALYTITDSIRVQQQTLKVTHLQGTEVDDSVLEILNLRLRFVQLALVLLQQLDESSVLGKLLLGLVSSSVTCGKTLFEGRNLLPQQPRLLLLVQKRKRLNSIPAELSYVQQLVNNSALIY